MLVDLHAYTDLTGGQELSELVADAQAKGLDAVCVVDREASAATARAVASGAFDFPVLVGVEIGTRSGDALVFVKDLDPVLTREEWRELLTLERPELSDVVAWTRERGGAVLLAHPYDRNRRLSPRDRMFASSKVDGVQVGSNDAEPRSNRVALEAVGKSVMSAFGGSACKNGSGDGSWLTLFASEVKSQDALIEAIKSGDFWAVQVNRTSASGNHRSPRSESSGGRDGRSNDRRPRDGGRSRRR